MEKEIEINRVKYVPKDSIKEASPMAKTLKISCPDCAGAGEGYKCNRCDETGD